MSTGNVNLDILLNAIKDTAPDSSDRQSTANAPVVNLIKKRYPNLSPAEAEEIYLLVSSALMANQGDRSELVVTAPPSFSVKARSTVNTVSSMILRAQNSILITGYSLSGYFGDLVDCMIQKSKSGVLIKFFANGLEGQAEFEKLLKYRGRFLRIYNYQKPEDPMSSLHAKVICVDQSKTLITSANLSYHGQEGNIEMGTYIESATIARQVDEVFTKLLFSKVFLEYM
jgi:phosphatidylserine/phosphatidylglycerophosphate/cardiolipin synthase-like enzyme